MALLTYYIVPAVLTADCSFDLGRLQDSHHSTPLPACPRVFVQLVLNESASQLAFHSPAGVVPHGLRKCSQLTWSALAERASYLKNVLEDAVRYTAKHINHGKINLAKMLSSILSWISVMDIKA